MLGDGDAAALYEQGAGAGVRSIMQAALQERNRSLGLAEATAKRPPVSKARGKAAGAGQQPPPPAPSKAAGATPAAAAVAPVGATTKDSRHMVVALLAKASPQAWLPAYTSLIKEKPDQAIAAWDDCYAQQVVRQGLASGEMGTALGVVDYTRTTETTGVNPRISTLPTMGQGGEPGSPA